MNQTQDLSLNQTQDSRQDLSLDQTQDLSLDSNEYGSGAMICTASEKRPISKFSQNTQEDKLRSALDQMKD